MTLQEWTQYGLWVLKQQHARMYSTEQYTEAQARVPSYRVRFRDALALLSRGGRTSSGDATRRARERRGTAG